MTEGALFAGIMGFGEGFRRAGFKNLWAVEREPFCRAVIKTQFPETELFSDVREVGKHNLKPVDVITAGFPCQDLSVAGKRAGLGGARSGLFWEVHRIVGELAPPWIVLENVPGLFSSNEGRDFAFVLDALDELRYGLAWRVLDSQFFGVAQRRRRVFIVGRFGAICPAEVLFERESGERDFAESEEERPELASEIAACLRGSGGVSVDISLTLSMALPSPEPSRNLTAKESGSLTSETLLPDTECRHSANTPMTEPPQPSSSEIGKMQLTSSQVRRLTPTECEILQGFPKGWTVPAIEHWGTRSRSKRRSGSREGSRG